VRSSCAAITSSSLACRAVLAERWFEDWVDAEARAAIIRWWEPLLVPGLFQMPEYSRALFRAWRTDDDEDKVEQLVTARMNRQRIFDRPKPPSFCGTR